MKKEVFWKKIRTNQLVGKAMEQIELDMEDVEDAEHRLERFAPFIMKCFPETKERNGIIESVLTPVPKMKDLLNEKYDSNLEGKLIIKAGQPSGNRRFDQGTRQVFMRF